MRAHKKGTADVEQQEEAQNIAKKQRALQITQLALELTSAIVGAIPIGNHGTSGKTGQENIANEKKNDMISVEGQAGHDKAVRHDAALASLEEEEDYSLYWLPVEEEEDEFLSAKDHRSVREDQDGDAQNAAAKPSQYYLKFSQDSLKDTAAAAAKVFEIAQAPWSSSSSESLLSRFKEIKAKTLPTYEETDDRVSYNTKLIDADWSDCLPLQYGLSKVMCDLFCLQDSVRAGTSAVLESLEDSHNILMQNLEALLDYQTSYILWALYNAAASATKDADLQTEAPPEASALLAALRQIDFKHVQATTPRLSRDILQWHQAAGQNLYNRLASLTVNASKQSWPLRVKAAHGMLHHFQASFQQRLRVGATEDPMADKMRLLREDTAQQHKLTIKAQGLNFDLSLKSSPSYLVEALLRCHEKHSTYVMLHSKALHQMDAALAKAQNFTTCNADTQALHEAWQLAVRAEERSQEVLIEAWAATVAGADSIATAFKDEQLLSFFGDEQLLSFLGDWAQDLDVTMLCQNATVLALQSQALAATALDRTAWALMQEVVTFQAVALYQEQQLKKKRLEHVALPDAWEALKIALLAAADPGQVLGQRLVASALQALGLELCPSPAGCVHGILVGTSAGGAVPCAHAGDGAHVLPKHFASKLIQQMPLRPKPLRSLTLMQMVEAAVGDPEL